MHAVAAVVDQGALTFGESARASGRLRHPVRDLRRARRAARGIRHERRDARAVRAAPADLAARLPANVPRAAP